MMHNGKSSNAATPPPPTRLMFDAYSNNSNYTDKNGTAASTDPSPVPNDNKGIVIMLHGWAQNVYVFSHRSKKLTKH
jgi:hypothetical protein